MKNNLKSHKKIAGLALLLAVALAAAGCGTTDTSTEEPEEEVDPDLEMGHGPAVEEEPEAEEPEVEEPEAEEPEAEEVDPDLELEPGPAIVDSDAGSGDPEFDASWETIQDYGFDNDEYSWRDYWSADYSYSPLSFSLTGGTVEDKGEYFEIQAVFSKPVLVPADPEVGDSYTAVINELTGETRTFTYVKEEGTGAEYYTTEDGWECYPTAADSDGMAQLLEGSADRLDAPFYDGVLWIRKDAVTGAAITDGPFVTVTEEGLSEDDWFNVVAFDDTGYVVQLIFEGD